MKRFVIALLKLLAAHLGCTIVLAFTVDPEIVLAALICTGIATLSLLLYAAMEQRRKAGSRMPEVAFLASLLPFAVYAAWCAFVGPEGKELATVVLGLYVLPSIFAMSLLLITRSS